MPNLIVTLLLTAVIAIVIIGLIVLAVRVAQRPRNALVGGGGIGPELIEQILQLKASDQFDQAVFLVRGETGMSHRAAARLVRKIHPTPPPPP
ncbi:hypothetical protein ABZV14_26925 [Streptosporangium canum]|uniref:hypothetical protein n=1 Tax=Streptosporangium canum TaxID=324952 RepID=UPI00339EE406